MESIDFKAFFNSPEPDTIEQQKAQPPYVYHCGIQQLEPYRQQERKPYTREELQGLERAQGTAVILDEISIYSYSCPTCQIKVMLNGGYGETVTCPVCERRIYRANDGEVMKVARDSRQAKVNNHYIQLDSYGRFKD